MEEIWKDIKGYEGLYQISNLGNVKSLNYRRRGYEKNLTPKRNNDGYLWVELRKDGKQGHYLIHRLVAIAFIQNPNKYPIINHKDENPLNCEVSNLEWCDYSYNYRYSVERHGNRIVKRSKYYNKSVVQKTLSGTQIAIFKNISEVVKTLGFNHYAIAECCNGNRKTGYGYKWEFAE